MTRRPRNRDRSGALVVGLSDDGYAIHDPSRRDMQWNGPWSTAAGLADAETSGADLASVVRDGGLVGRAAILLIPREHVTLKLLELPGVADDALDAAVALQVEARSPFALEDTSHDYVVVPDASGTTRQIVLALYATSRLTALTDVMSRAGLEAVGARVGEFCLASVPSTGIRETGVVVHVVDDAATSTVVLSVAGAAVASACVPTPQRDAADVRRVGSIVRRLVSGLPEPLGGTNAETGVVHGASHDAFVEHVADELDLDFVEGVASVAEAVVTAFSPHDFLSPRTVSGPNGWTRWIRTSALVAGLLVAVCAWSYLRYGDVARRVAELEAKRDELVALVDHGRDLQREAALVAAWEAGRVDWRAEIARIADSFPEAKRAYVDSLEIDEESRDGLALLRIRGRAGQPDDVLALQSRLASEIGGYRVSPHVIEPISNDDQYHVQFEIEATIRTDGGERPPLPRESVPKTTIVATQ